MPSNSQSASADDFFRIAQDLVMLTKDEALIVAEAVKSTGHSPEQIAQQKGYLDAGKVDIIDTLMHPRETVPGYEILDVLGQGGMGVVYQARQLNLNRIVALKTILLSRMTDKSAAGRFEQEAQTVGKLRHPNIIAAYDFGRHEGRLYLAMELVEGEDIEALLACRGRLDEATAWGLARQAAAGLAHADHLGVVHRDIKPANLLLVEPPEGYALPNGMSMVKIADFGLAFLADDQHVQTRLTSDRAAVGSPHYMAPEQLTEMHVDFRADIYALGATVYHMLAGRPPFGELNLSQIVAQKLSGEIQPLSERCPDLSDASCRLVARMLSRDPLNRPGDYQTLMQEIQQVTSAPGTTSTMLPVSFSLGSAGIITDVVSTQETQAMPAVQQASDVSKPAAPSHQHGKRRLTIASIAVATLLTVGVTSWQFRAAPDMAVAPQPVKMRNVGWANSQFNGESLGKPWIHDQGNWIVGADDEGASVIEGTDGELARTLFRPAADGKTEEPIWYYRLTLEVQPHQATAVEVRFGYELGDDRDTRGYAARIDANGITLGERAARKSDFEPLMDSLPLVREFQRRHAVHVERHPTGWFVTIDGQDLPGLPHRAEGELPEFRLAAEKGPAWFSNISAQELEPASAANSVTAAAE